MPMIRRMAKMDPGQSFVASLVTMDHHCTKMITQQVMLDHPRLTEP